MSRPVADGGLRRSVVSGGTYALANAAQRALVFLLLPVYTAVLSPAEYGSLGVLLTVQSGAVVIFGAGMEPAVTRRFFILEGDASAQQGFVISAWTLLALGATVAALAVGAAMVLVIPDSAVFRSGEAALSVGSAAVFVAATTVPLTVLRAEQRLRDFLKLTAVAGISTTLFTVLAVIVLDLGVSGWFIAALVSNALTLAAAVRVVPWKRVAHFDRENVRLALLLGVTLIPHALSLWALQLADRLVLTGLVSAAALGVYTLAANLALPASVVIQSLNQGFMPSYARRRSIPGASAELRSTVGLQLIFVLVVGFASAMLAPAVVGLLTGEYRAANEVVPWLVLGYVFWGFYQVPMNLISLTVGRTGYVWLLGLSSVMASVVALLVLVPPYGIQGAGAASALGYLVLLVLTVVYAVRLHIEVSLPAIRVLIVAAAIGSLYAIGAVLLPQEGVTAAVLRIAFVGLLVPVLAVAGGDATRTASMAAVRRVLRR